MRGHGEGGRRGAGGAVVKLYAGAVAIFYHSGKVRLTPVYMEAQSWQHAMQAAYKAIKSQEGYDKTEVRELSAAMEEVTPEWLGRVGYQKVTQ